jgi:hypothetical protein
VSSPEEPSPVFGSWKRAYAAVLLNLAVLILLLYGFTKLFE